MTPPTDLTVQQAERIILEWGDAVAAIQSAPGAPDYVDVGRAIAMGDLMADALRAALPREAPPVLVALVQEWQAVYRGYEDGKQDLAELDRRLRPATDALLAWTPDAAPAPEGATQHWSVSVSRNGANLVTIESNMLAGQPEFSDEDARVIRECAAHLLAFIGPAAPPAAAPPQGADDDEPLFDDYSLEDAHLLAEEADDAPVSDDPPPPVEDMPEIQVGDIVTLLNADDDDDLGSRLYMLAPSVIGAVKGKPISEIHRPIWQRRKET